MLLHLIDSYRKECDGGAVVPLRSFPVKGAHGDKLRLLR